MGNSQPRPAQLVASKLIFMGQRPIDAGDGSVVGKNWVYLNTNHYIPLQILSTQVLSTIKFLFYNLVDPPTVATDNGYAKIQAGVVVRIWVF